LSIFRKNVSYSRQKYTLDLFCFLVYSVDNLSTA
jgi:hypothetical protein